jgi:ech hydrogenase subunit D
MNEQIIIDVNKDELIDKVVIMKSEDYRLVQISCTYKDGYELIYSFDKDYHFVNYRVHIERDTEILSISHVFFPAFLYENEMKDLFGVKIKDIAIDYKGGLYKVAQKAAFAPKIEKEEA